MGTKKDMDVLTCEGSGQVRIHFLAQTRTGARLCARHVSRAGGVLTLPAVRARTR